MPLFHSCFHIFPRNRQRYVALLWNITPPIWDSSNVKTAKNLLQGVSDPLLNYNMCYFSTKAWCALVHTRCGSKFGTFLREKVLTLTWWKRWLKSPVYGGPEGANMRRYDEMWNNKTEVRWQPRVKARSLNNGFSNVSALVLDVIITQQSDTNPSWVLTGFAHVKEMKRPLRAAKEKL